MAASGARVALDAFAASGGVAGIETLTKIFGNVVSDPDAPKFRRLNATNAALQRLIFSHPGGRALVEAFGFRAEGVAYVLPGAPEGFDLEVLQVVADKLGELKDAEAAEQRAAVAREAEGRAKELAAADKARETARLERERIVAQAKRDQEERRKKDSERGPVASHAKVLTPGARVTRYADIGVDLCAKGGG